MVIATWNVNGIRARQAQLCEWVERDRPDVLCLQELKAEQSQIPMQCQFEEYWAFWHCFRAYSGVSLHIRKDLMPDAPTFTHPDFDMESRMVQADLGALIVASVYVPNGGKDFPAKMEFIRRLIAWAARLRSEGRELVLCGDMNVARAEIDVHPKERKATAIGQLPEERALIEELLATGLVDVGRTREPENDGLFTWWAPWRNMRQRNIGWRLDYTLASTALASRVTSCVVLRDVGTSDHAPVALTIA
jgi:exodeoxyribonuclease-3